MSTHSNSGPVFLFSAESMSLSEASVELYGSDYTGGSSDKVIKLVLNADMARASHADIESITGADINLNLDWSLFETITIGAENDFIAKQYMDGAFLVTPDPVTGAPIKIVLT
ncbi:MAG: hypothetical protein NZ730_08945, partial [Porticoccaceae bacterium]|nr:hypothetical protein [Porticoccaceae bacterium]